jgi:hypothetical protein
MLVLEERMPDAVENLGAGLEAIQKPLRGTK